MATGTYVLEIAWDGSTSTFTATGANVTARTFRVEFTRGRGESSQLTGRSIAGNLQAVLNNESGDYNSYNSTGPLSGSLLPGRLVQFRATGPTAGTLWTGYIDKIIPGPSIKGRDTAVIEAHGPLGRLNQKELSLPHTSSIDTGTAVALILTEAGWPSGGSFRDLDAGKTTIVRHWEDRRRTMEALRRVEETEAGFIRESGKGQIVFENRHRRLTSPYTTSQAIFTDSSTGTLVYQGIEQEDPLPFLFNDFQTMVNRFTTGSTGTLWILSETGTASPIIHPSSTRTFFAPYPNPTSTLNSIGVVTWITPTATTDWNIFTDQAATGTNLNGSSTIAVTSFVNSLKITLTNNSTSVGYVTKLQAQGIPLLKSDPVVIRTEDVDSGTRYGERTFSSRAGFVPSTDEAKDWGDWHVALYKDPTPRLRMSYVANKDNAHLTQAILREVSDRITVVATGTRNNLGINRDFFIERVHHVIEADRTHRVTYYLSEAEQFSDAWTLDVSNLGTNSRLTY